MTRSEFSLLTDSEQIDTIYRHGIYIGKRKVDICTVLLYQVDSFYVELHYLLCRKQINHILLFDSTQVLEPYLDQIDVAELVNAH